jgi:hypothetical protein
MHQRMGARPFVARTQYAYAAMLVARNAPGDAAQAHHPALGHHLATHLKTGLFCQYRPAPGQPTCWTL